MGNIPVSADTKSRVAPTERPHPGIDFYGPNLRQLSLALLLKGSQLAGVSRP